MPTFALITKPEDIRTVVFWSSEFAKAMDSPLTILCWAYSPFPESSQPEKEYDELVAEVRQHIDQADSGGALSELAESGRIEVQGILSVEPSKAVINLARRSLPELIVAAAHPTGAAGGAYATNPLLRHSPCNTIILFGGEERSCKADNLAINVTDGPHDGSALILASRMVGSSNAHVTLVRTETDIEQEAMEVSHRELLQLKRDSGVENEDQIECRVFRYGDHAIADAIEEHDLLIVRANHPRLSQLLEMTTHPTVAVMKRVPPLRPWRLSKRSISWDQRLSPADYADLIQGLRRGSRLSADFLTMLCLATVVATMGLLQDSPAVVIGSMLLAPLMTPMLGGGLALAQANPRLANRSLTAVCIGLLCTLLISFFLGVATPSSELTPQVLARCNPTVLDLIIAAASGAAAAYALARPNLVGSIAGVAIATALVPPLCAVGITFAYGSYVNSMGAALLFGTNFVAIVLSAALTFRLMGVTSVRVEAGRRTWVFRTLLVMGLSTVVLYVPLHIAMMKSLVETKPQPINYPLAKSVLDALEESIESEPSVELITAGRPSSHYEKSDVILILGAPHEVDPEYAETLAEIVRREMKNDSLVVEVHCIREIWQKIPE